MSTEGLHYKLVAAFERIERSGSSGEAVECFLAVLGRTGVDHMLISGLPADESRHWQDDIIHCAWPSGWLERYVAKDHLPFDPCVERSRLATAPFLWSDIELTTLHPRQITVMREAMQFSMNNGLCVPIHQPRRPPAVVSMAGAEFDHKRLPIPLVEALAQHLFRVICRFRGIRQQVDAQALTRREREVLHWAAAGKTAEDVGCILGIRRQTVECHLMNVRTKLDAINTTHAIVKAIRLGEIHP